MRRLIIIIMFLTGGLSVLAQSMAVVDLSVAHLREQPAYEAEMGTEALMGAVVSVLESEGYWTKVRTPDGYVAWTNDMSLCRMTEDEMAAYMEAPKLVCTAIVGRILSKPGRNSLPVSDLVRGDVLIDKGQCRNGFVKVSTVSSREGWVRKKDLEDYAKWQSGQLCSGENLVREALNYLGVPYLWGGYSVKGFDCSGLTAFCFLMNGKMLPRNASQQAQLGRAIDMSKLASGDCGDLQKGDLLFFGDKETGKVSHVGMYIGGGKMIHSSQLVRINSILSGQSDSYESMHRLLQVRRLCDE